ncbi:MAG: YkgJ family cysteine cluster protein [Phycisphaerae bacterium]
MKIFASKPDWFVAGLAFECQQCGRCCAGPEEGYVWVTPDEITTIAEHLGLPRKEFMKRHVRRVGTRYSLKECKPSHDCIFLQPIEGQDGWGCAIYEVRPTQCRTWPFWHSNIHSPEAWALAGDRCVGINRGPLHDPEEIHARADATRGD